MVCSVLGLLFVRLWFVFVFCLLVVIDCGGDCGVWCLPLLFDVVWFVWL